MSTPTSNTRIRTMIVEDQFVVRVGLTAIINSQRGSIVGSPAGR